MIRSHFGSSALPEACLVVLSSAFRHHAQSLKPEGNLSAWPLQSDHPNDEAARLGPPILRLLASASLGCSRSEILRWTELWPILICACCEIFLGLQKKRESHTPTFTTPHCRFLASTVLVCSHSAHKFFFTSHPPLEQFSNEVALLRT